MGLFVNYNSTVIHSEDDGEKYGEWFESKYFYVESVSLSKTKALYEEYFNVNFEVKPGDVVFVLYIRFRSGDSFGVSEGNGDIVWVFKDLELAKKAEKQIKQECKNYSICIDIGHNKPLIYGNPSMGYFESLEDVCIESCIVQP